MTTSFHVKAEGLMASITVKLSAVDPVIAKKLAGAIFRQSQKVDASAEVALEFEIAPPFVAGASSTVKS